MLLIAALFIFPLYLSFFTPVTLPELASVQGRWSLIVLQQQTL